MEQLREEEVGDEALVIRSNGENGGKRKLHNYYMVKYK
jgi:hypothetical protein